MDASIQTLTFSTNDGGKTFSRKLYGFEALASSYAAEADGLFFFTGSCLVRLSSPLSREALISAWIRLRYLAPAVACRTSFIEETKDWLYHYTVPQNLADAKSWAQETIVWHDDEKSFADTNTDMVESYWNPALDRPACVLHATPVRKNQNQWTLSIHGNHGNIDGRSSMALFDQLLTFLNETLVRPPGGDEYLKWGSEIERLGAASVILTGEFEAHAKDEIVAPEAPPPGFIPFMAPLVENTAAATTSVVRVIKLDAPQTAKLRALCKSKGRTITHVVDSILALADVEAVLVAAKTHDKTHVENVLTAYEKATHWLMALTMKDQRVEFPQHSKLVGPKGTNLFAVDGYSIAVEMAKIREALKFNKEFSTVDRDTSDTIFWNGIVANFATSHKGAKVDAVSYVTREKYNYSQTKLPISAAPMSQRFGTFSSIGHLEALGYFTPFVPSVAASTGNKVTLEDVSILVRPSLPLMITTYWQFDGKMTFCLHTGAKWQTDAEIDAMASAFKGWMNALLV